MAINLNKLDIGALAQLASNVVPNLNLPLHGIEWGAGQEEYAKTALARMALQNQAAGQQNEMDIAKLNNAGLFDRSIYNNEADNQRAMFNAQAQAALEQTKMGNTNQQNALNRQNLMQIAQDRNALTQQQYDQLQRNSEFDNQFKLMDYSQDQQRLDQQQAMDLAKLDFQKQQEERLAKSDALKNQIDTVELHSKLEEKDLQKRQNYAAAYLIGVQQNPQDEGTLRDFLITKGVKDGVYSPEEVEEIKKASPVQLQAMAVQTLGVTEAAKMFKQNQKSGDQGGVSVIKHPDGTTEVNVAPSKETTTDAQKDLGYAQQNIKMMEQIATDYKKDFLTAEGRAKAKVGAWSSYFPSLQVKDWADLNTKKSEVQSQMTQLTFGMMKQLSGVQYSDKQLQAMADALVQSSDDPSSFEGKFRGMIKTMKAVSETKSNLLKDGVKLASPEADQRMMESLSKIQDKNETIYTYRNEKTGQEFKFPESALEAQAKRSNISVEELKKSLIQG